MLEMRCLETYEMMSAGCGPIMPRRQRNGFGGVESFCCGCTLCLRSIKSGLIGKVDEHLCSGLGL